MIRLCFAGALPREGQASETCEDRFAFRQLSDQGWRVAVADGAGSTLFSGLWAELLTSAFVAQDAINVVLPDISALRRQWYETVTRSPLPWHQQAQLSHGAAAAFIGVVITPSGKW